MSKDSTNWDSIASLEGLGVDWGFEPENPMGKRAYARLSTEDLCHIFQVEKIPVMLVTEKGQVKTFLVDISQGGLSLRTKAEGLKKLQFVKIGCFLGKLKLVSKGRIRGIRKDADWNIIGIEFVGLSEENNNFLSSIYSSAKL